MSGLKRCWTASSPASASGNRGAERDRLNTATRLALDDLEADPCPLKRRDRPGMAMGAASALALLETPDGGEGQPARLSRILHRPAEERVRRPHVAAFDALHQSLPRVIERGGLRSVRARGVGRSRCGPPRHGPGCRGSGTGPRRIRHDQALRDFEGLPGRDHRLDMGAHAGTVAGGDDLIAMGPERLLGDAGRAEDLGRCHPLSADMERRELGAVAPASRPSSRNSPGDHACSPVAKVQPRSSPRFRSGRDLPEAAGTLRPKSSDPPHS